MLFRNFKRKKLFTATLTHFRFKGELFVGIELTIQVRLYWFVVIVFVGGRNK